ncbi:MULTISPECIES: hypothetical protein [unclassified Sinorhizobium]|uniref:hypothetical protein n=1 Tax=unclassified Sinorhizobium TaxID=2613772 RepID=UPI0024C44C5E|nr:MULTISPECIES: hypothetical protein [unclassified Sinorhizobium]MDK1377086.1 hypothetical protein [Sinorhizobium sp. 6-70]MDK1479619.1 hypothetical protein [Sinorhizobium sp. 6-117]
MTISTGNLTLNSVSEIRRTKEADVFAVSCNITDMEGETYDAVSFVRPDDPFGLNPVLRQWMTDNPDFPVGDYIPPTPEEIRAGMPPLTARQLRLGLINNGFTLAQVGAVIEAMPDGPDKETARIEWEFATNFNRMHPLIASVGSALGLTDIQIDTMWTAAVNL